MRCDCSPTSGNRLEAAYAGDVVGLANPGAFAIGDALFDGEPVAFAPVPAFAPEHFAAVRSIDTSGYKSFGKGIAQLREEGAVQVFYPLGSTRTEPILAVVGELQFEVAKYRLEAEYNVKTAFSQLPFSSGAARRGRPHAESRAHKCRRTQNSSRIGTAVRPRFSRASGACGWPKSGTRNSCLLDSPPTRRRRSLPHDVCQKYRRRVPSASRSSVVPFKTRTSARPIKSPAP